VGAYERVAGVARGELDPADPHNAGIVNLDKAPRNARGQVEYETDFYLLRPVEAARGNRKIIYEVNNADASSCCTGCSMRRRRQRVRTTNHVRSRTPATACCFASAIRSPGAGGIRTRRVRTTAWR